MGILVIPLLDFLQNRFVLRFLPFCKKLVTAALGPDLGGGGEENLHRCLGQNYGPNVPAIHDDVVLFGDFPLHIQQHFPHAGVGGNQAGFLRNLLGADVVCHIHPIHYHVLQAAFVIFNSNGQLINVTVDPIHILGADTPKIHKICHRAINRAGIHITIPQLRGKLAGNGALPGPGGAIDGYGNSFHHDIHPLLF